MFLYPRKGWCWDAPQELTLGYGFVTWSQIRVWVLGLRGLVLRPATSVLDPAAVASAQRPELRNPSSAEAPGVLDLFEAPAARRSQTTRSQQMDDRGCIHSCTCINMETLRGHLANDGADKHVGTKARLSPHTNPVPSCTRRCIPLRMHCFCFHLDVYERLVDILIYRCVCMSA